MKVIVTGNFEQTCETAANLISGVIANKPDARLGLATGSSAGGVYPYLIKANKEKKIDFSKVSTINLDEYAGLPPDHTQSYRYFMDTNLFDHVNIDKSNTFVASGIGDPEKIIGEFRAQLKKAPIDIQLLGIGVDGHIGFNEPGNVLYCDAHAEELTNSTIEANSRFFNNRDEVPIKAYTMGMGDIMRAKRLVLVATGAQKAEAVRGLIIGDEVTTRNPSTFIKLHPDAVVIIDKELADLVGYKN
ncbi:MAG: Glucosamine-6-phosphate deaminase 1 [Firmicutes bacterium ADurb.Bin182]|nr:MAG: Glucosamine-6-phosphate deaminase 1 [Firmicutes bacterium ADurb.Bin182]